MTKTICVLLAGASLLSAAEILQLGSDTVSAGRIYVQKFSTDQGYRFIPIEERRGERTIGEFLATVPGVSVKQTGSSGSFETVSIRGVDGSRVSVCVDGVPVQSAMGGPVDLSRFSLESCEGIEIYRGIAPAKFGGNSLGGVINLVTKKEKTGTKEISVLTGSFGEFQAGARIVSPLEKSTVRGGVSYHRAENDFPYLDRNATSDNFTEDTLRNLANNGFTEFNGTFKVEHPFKIGEFSAGWETREKRLEIPAGEEAINQTAVASEQENRFSLGLDSYGKIDFNQSLTMTTNSNEVFWTGLDNFGSVHGQIPPGQSGELKSETILIDYRPGYRIIPVDFLTITGTISGRYEEMTPSTDVASFGFGEWNSSRVSGSNATDLLFSLKKFTATLGGSVTVHRSHTEGGKDPYTLFVLENKTVIETDPSGRIGFTFAPIEPVSLFANSAIYSRTASLRERFGYQGGVLPSPNLKMESGKTAEIGGSYTVSKLRGELLFFANHFNDMITTIFDGRVSRATNIGENRTFGIEQSVLWKAVSKVTIRESMTLQKPENLSEYYNYKGKFLPNQAPFTIYGDCSVGPFGGFTFTPQIKWQSLLYRDQENTKLFPAVEGAKGKLYLSCFAKWNHDWVTISGSVRNILDGRTSADARYSMESGYIRAPYPGRAWQVEIQTAF